MGQLIKKLHYCTSSEKELLYNIEKDNWNILCNPNINSSHIHGTREKRLVNCGRCLTKLKKLEAKKND